MSGRLFKKVLQEQELKLEQNLEKQQVNGGVDVDESSSEYSPPVSKKNPFDLLNDDDGLDNHDDDVSEQEANDKHEISLVNKDTTNGIPPPHNKSKKKNKKKKKNRKDALPSANKSEKSPEVTLANLSLNEPSRQPPTSTRSKASVAQCQASLLQVDPMFLRAENELRRIFGSKVVRSFENSNETSSSRQMRGVKRGYHHKKTSLVSHLDHWPRWDGSLSMELLETKDGYHYFRYVHSPSYSHSQKAFEAAKASHNLEGVAGILTHHKYHLDALITLSEYLTFVGDHQMAIEGIGKCLYGLECAWHPLFTPLQSNCRLKFCYDENKPVFKALFIHMKNMDRRGCHRCALEVCKLLLSLDPDDPMGSMFCIDYFALRAEQYKWLERFSEEYISDNSLWSFPNFSYSLAVCRFYLEQNESSGDQQTAKATSTDLMKQALMLHPLVLKKLVTKVPLKDQVLTNVLKHEFFKSEKTGIPSVDHLINIYVERSYLIWRLPDLQKLLKDSAKLVIETLEKNSSEARDWTCVRKEAFSSEKNEYEHLLVSDFSDSIPTMPPENLQNFMAGEPGEREVGDLPPAVDRLPHDLANRHPLVVLLESMLPWVDYGGREDEGGDIGEEDPHNEDN